MKFLSNIREFFWPLLEPETEQKKNPYEEAGKIVHKIEEVHSSGISILLEEAVRAYSAENQRRATIEGKAATMIGFNGVIIALIINAVSWFIKEPKTKTIVEFITIIIIFFAIIYFLRAILYALTVLKRASYVTVTAEKLLEQNMSNEQAFTKSLIGLYISSTVSNYKIINEKVDNMVMAYEYLRRGIFTLGVLTLWIIGSFIHCR